VGQRFYLDFKARVELPLSYLAHVGETYRFVVKARDHGINTTPTTAIEITILGDEKAPQIRILEPPANVYESQPLTAAVQFSDNLSLSAYKVYIEEAPLNILAEADGLDTTFVKTADLPIDLSDYDPRDESRDQFVLVAEAVDAYGNQAREIRVVNVQPDQPPRLSVVDEFPADNLIKGGVAFQTIRIEDDYVTAAAPLRYFPIYTSLKGLGGSGSRDPAGHLLEMDGESIPHVTMDYPEADGLPGRLLIKGRPYIEADAGQLTVWPTPTEPLDGDNHLKLDFGPEYTVVYRITTFHEDECEAMTTERLVEDNPEIDLAELIRYTGSSRITAVQIEPQVADAAGAPVETFLSAIHIDALNLSQYTSYPAGRGTRSLPRNEALISVFIADDADEGRRALVASHPLKIHSGRRDDRGTQVVVPVHYDIKDLQVLAHGVDRLSPERSPQPLKVLSVRAALPDEAPPEVVVKSPANGITLVPLQQITLKVEVTDNSDGFASLQLFQNGDILVREIGGTFGREAYTIPYQVPLNYTGGRLDLMLVAEDLSGAAHTKTLSFPIAVNEPPQLTLSKFSSYKVNGSYRKVLDTPERVNYGEFWVRVGEDFKLDVTLADDAGLRRYAIYRLDRAGNRVQLYRKDYGPSCPTPPVTASKVGREVTFDQVEPTQYEAVVTDTYGHETSRTFLVHPLTNMVPQIRVTSPAQGQYIVAGTFRIKVGVVVTDDRILSDHKIEIFANGIKLRVEGVEDAIDRKNAIGGYGAVVQAFGAMYDAIEQNYTVELAEEYGNLGSPYAKQLAYTMAVPAGLIRFNEPVTLMARVRDSDNAVNRHEITFLGAADEINPEVAITRPQPGYGPVEASDFTLGFRAYDNVKVAQLEAYMAYGAREAGGTYRRSDYGTPIRFVRAIQAHDFQPVTTVNIDTPEYKQLVHVVRIHEIGDLIPDLNRSSDTLYDVWVKVVARDHSGNERTREVSFPVRVDERPVVDIVSPVNGAKIVEGSALNVNVNSFDDVGIDSLRLTATHGSGQVEVYNILLRQPPYQFQVAVPDFDVADPAQNTLRLQVEAIDSYGAQFGDLDQHRATEDMALEIIEDQPPAVAIGLPPHDSDVTEGDFLLVQVNAVDDVAIDRVVLNVAGLINGDRSFTDTSFPYEYLVEIPYGQAGQDLNLTATATEIRLRGNARSVATPTPTIVHVRKDETAPEIVVLAPPGAGATVVEKRTLRFAAEVSDNVRVSTLKVALLADKDADGQFSAAEEVAQRLLLAPPHIGTIAVKSLAAYLGAAAEGVDQLALLLKFTATDGAGNQSEVSRPVTLVRNQPPQVEQIQILDSRGFNLGHGLAEITEGRGIVVNVIASDREAGVDAVSLFRAVGGESEDAEYEKVGRDEAAPFQFHITVPQGRVGETLRFKAEAVDVDGYTSPLSAARGLTILADQPPVATITQPDNDESVIIDGQDIEVFVEAVDDLGISGIDRVVFYVNEVPVQTAYNSWSEVTGSAAQEHVYRALISPPEGARGFVIYAVAYDVLGQTGRTQTVRVGRIEDTVAPKLSVLAPADGDILTAGRAIRPVVAVADIGVAADRRVYMQFIREYQEAGGGAWITLFENEIELFRDDARSAGDATPVSDPDNHYYVYWADFVDGDILRRTAERNERVRTISRIVTPNHTVSRETVHEIGLPVSQRRYLLPAPGAFDKAKSVYYTAVDQFRGPDRTGALVAAWATQDPLRLEPAIGNLTLPEFEPEYLPRTGLFIADDTNEAQGADGSHYVYSELMAGAAEMFTGTITELYADADFVLAAKSGEIPVKVEDDAAGAFAGALQSGIQQNPETGGVYLDNAGGELLIYTVRNGDEQFGLPYLLAGRVDMPYPDVYGVARKDDLVLVANGNGGVQVIDISDLAAPYHVGYIKPNGFTRDVAVTDHFALIAASHEGLVIADLKDPSLPIVAVHDTLGVANRLFIEGSRVYVTDMAGDGQVSQLNIIDIRDPYNPFLEGSVELRPARADLTADGVYDAFVAGGKAYVTVHYSDQEDRPAQSVVEIIDLGGLGDPLADATIPAVIHRRANANDIGARGLVLARGALQVAGARQGLDRIEFPALTVLAHTPAMAEHNIATDLDKITIELSAVLPAGTDLSDFVRVHAMDPIMGEDAGALFEVDFGVRDGEPARRFLELSRIPTEPLQANTQYFVTVARGLAPLTGLPLAEDYIFNFTTVAVDGAVAPDIQAIVPAFGSIEGNTPVVISGTGFGADPALYLGGQRLVIDRVVTAVESGEAYDRIEARTVPNYAGPAAVEVVNEHGLADVVLGAFTYLDILQISFIDPAVVRVSQAGRGDRVEVVGYGFHEGVVLRAYKSGRPDTVITTTVDNDRLSLYSAEKMTWVVPDFGDSFRGFVDVDISDDQGRRFLLPNGLFYGRLQEDRRLQPEAPFTKGQIDGYLNAVSAGYVPDTLKLPPGDIVATESDPSLGLVYVLGEGLLANDVSPQEATDEAFFHRYFAPGWISLVHYERDDLANAAPMHGLGYFNLPQDLVPVTMVLAEKQLYVAAEGYHFPYIETPYEDRKVILVYDREDRLPGAGGTEQTDGKDRDILYSLPLNFETVPVSLAVKDNLLFAASPDDGVAVISVADPLKPSVIRILAKGRANGQEYALNPRMVRVVGDTLHVAGGHGRFSFDISKPTLPQLGYAGLGGYTEVMHDQPILARSNDQSLNLSLYDLARPNHLRLLGRYDPRGFSLPGEVVDLFALTSVAGTNAQYLRRDDMTTVERSAYLSLFDTSRPDQITLIDGLKVSLPVKNEELLGSQLTEDGILLVASKKRLIFIDTLTLDLVASEPAAGAVGVPTDSPVVLTFNRPLEVPAGETLEQYLASYLQWVLDDGTDQGQPVAFGLAFDDQNPQRLILNPGAALTPDANYRVRLKSELGSRRTRGLFDHVIDFKTGLDNQPTPEILSVAPGIINTTGGTVTVTLRHGNEPVFSLAGDIAPVLSAQSIAADETAYEIDAPANAAGPARLTVTNQGGGLVQLTGALQYVEPLHLLSVSPAQGSVNGGTAVTIKGMGFRPGLLRVQVSFGEIPVPDEDIRVIDSETLAVVTPAGRIGAADVTVTLDNGQTETLSGAYNYQQPIQSNIEASKGRIYDLVLDPTGVYLVAAAGREGVYIYNVDASTYTANAANPLNPDDLRRRIDFDGDKIDDRILARVPLPSGYVALGVDTYFERGVDRVMVTGTIPGQPQSARLFVIGFDALDMTNTTVIASLPLHADLARGVDAENSRALVAMGQRGVGLVDIFLQTKAYLTSHLTLPDGHGALDAARVPVAAGQDDLYAVASGRYDIGANRLVDEDDPASGAFYLVSHGAVEGFRLLGRVDVAASRVAIAGTTAYLAAGDAGLVIVDISDPNFPTVISRVNNIGHVHDVDVNGNTVYLAQGQRGIATVDVTDPRKPLVPRGMEVVLAGNYAALGGGTLGTGGMVVQVTPDVVLKVFRLEPQNGILDRDAAGELTVWLRFSKAIDLWPDNHHRFAILDARGTPLAFDVTIVNNDAILTLRPGHGLTVGDRLSVVARAGIETVKPVTEDIHIVLYRLARDQQFELIYRGDRPDTLRVEAVVPRRIPQNRSEAVTIAGLGIPTDPARVRVFVGGLEAQVTDIVSEADDERLAIVTARVPAIVHAGQYDVALMLEKAGIWQTAVLAGGLMVDAPIEFERLEPAWGPVSGGTTVTIYGRGFEPGNTVMEGLTVRVGDVPVAGIKVLSTERIEIVTRGGRVGKNDVHGQDRYDNRTSLLGDAGFGFGLKQIASQAVGFFPSDVHVDQETGVALTNGGYFYEGRDYQTIEGEVFTENTRAAAFDIQNPTQPLLVGGVSSLPSGERGRALLKRVMEYKKLLARLILEDALSPEDQARLDELEGTYLATALDSVRILPVQELEEGVVRKRLYVAGGSGGVARLNLDEQNGLQLLSQVLDMVSSEQVGAVAKSGYVAFAARAHDVTAPPPQRPEICKGRAGNDPAPGSIERLNYLAPADPVQTGALEDSYGNSVTGGNAVIIQGDWLFAGGKRYGYRWYYPCPNTRDLSGLKPKDNSSDTVRGVNIYDRVLTREYTFDNNVRDLAAYGDYLIAAVGGSGLEIFHRERPETRITLELDDPLQHNSGPVVRLRRLANLLFASADGGGVIVIDLADPMNPRVVSAGNDETIEAVDFYKDRLVAVASGSGLAVFDLPGAFVAATAVDENAYIADNESYEVTFNEFVTEASLQQPGAVSVARFDTAEAVNATVTAVDPVDGSSNRFAIDFDRLPGIVYEIRIQDARNLRSGGLWVPFAGRVTAAAAGARRPVIAQVQGGAFHRGDQPEIIIKGSGFRNHDDLKVYVDQYELSPVWQDANTLRLPAGSVAMLPLETGEHHLRVADQELYAGIPGAVVIGEELDLVTWALSPESGSIKGGRYLTIRAGAPAILPGAKVIMRSRRGDEIRTEAVSAGVFVSDLGDDVVDLQTFRFMLPGVVVPDLYEVYLEMGNKEVLVGSFSYSMDAGRGIDLPNYPPMVIGAAEARGDTLFVGIKDGLPPAEDNRFLMEAGFEIYDISIWDRPIRRSQVQLQEPVTGLATYGRTAYLASGSQGLVVVDIHDFSQPHVLLNFGVPGHTATDVALNRSRGVLALAVASPLGGGYIRFFDVGDPELDPPPEYGTIALADDEIIGEPVDIEWQDDRLFVLLNRQGQLHLLIFDNPADPLQYTLQSIERGELSADPTDASFAVQYGQIAVTTGEEYLILQPDESGAYRTIYWQSTAGSANELVPHQGAIFMADPQGVSDTPTPDLAVTAVSPAYGADLVPGDTIRIQLNQLMDTDAVTLEAGVQLVQLVDENNGAALPADSYTLTGINTLAGGYIDLTLSPDLTDTGPVRLQIGTALKALNGHHLLAAVTKEYAIVSGVRPQITDVRRLVDGQPVGPYFHGDDSGETARIEGSGFGTDPQALEIQVGRTVLPVSRIVDVTDTAIRVSLPQLDVSLQTASLAVGVTREGVKGRLNGAIVIQPRVILQDIDPLIGPPQGGNRVALYGVGFSHDVMVKFGGVIAGDLRLKSSAHLEVRAPAGSFGYVDVSVESRLFPDEISTLPSAYFYANRETGAVDLSQDGHQSSPVTGIVVRDQILYAVTGGGYQAMDRQGRILGQLSTPKAQLVLSDISDPVHPELIYKEVADQRRPYHLSVTLPPEGFKDLALDGTDLFLVGGQRLYHMDVTLAADPLLLADRLLDGAVESVLTRDGLLYVATANGIRIFQLLPDRNLREIAALSDDHLGGSPTAMVLDEKLLWVALPSVSRAIAIDLMAGDYAVANSVDLVDLSGRPIRPASMLLRDDLLLVSGGAMGTVTAYAVRPEHTGLPVAQFSLAYLIPNGDVFAGEMMRYGQTLYVAAGQGDLQLFDISAWLDGQFRQPVTLKNYYAVTGAIDAIAFGRGALYAGTAFVYVNNEPAENPLEVGTRIGHLGGTLNTLVNEQLTIVAQIPEPRAVLPAGRAVEVQFNRIIDPRQLADLADALFEVSLSGSPVAGYVASQINNTGSRLIFRPASPFIDQKEYQVRISAALADIHGQTLARDYRFRFVAADHRQPVIKDVQPAFGSWRGGDEIVVTGENFNPATSLTIGGLAVPADQIINRTDSEMAFILPALDSAPVENRLVGIAVANGFLQDFKAGQFTYVTDPVIESIGQFNPVTTAIYPADQRFLFNAGEYAAVRGSGLNVLSRITVNGRPAREVTVVDSRTLSFRVPDDTVGPLTVAVSNLIGGTAQVSDTATNTDLRLEFESSLQVRDKALLLARHADLMLLYDHRFEKGVEYFEARLDTTRDGTAPVFLARIPLNAEVHAMALSGAYAVFNVGDDHELVVYDIGNVYAPARINRIANPDRVNHQRLHLAGETFVSQSDSGLHMGHVRGAAWQTLTPDDPVIDMVADDHYIYLLQDYTLEARPIDQWETVAANLPHTLLSPQQLRISAQRLAALGDDRLELLLTGSIEGSGRFEKLGATQMSGLVDLAINGELLAVVSSATGSRRLVLYDMNMPPDLDNRLALEEVARVYNSDGWGGIAQLNFNGDLLEWRRGSGYYNLPVPLLNSTGPTPRRYIGAENELLALQVTGDPAGWEAVTLDVRRTSDPAVLPGPSRLLGRDLQFQVIGDAYELDQDYEISLFNEPQPVIDGGVLDHDLAWQLRSAPLFGVEPIRVYELSPATTVTGRPTRFTIRGVQLDQATGVTLNNLAIDASAWTVRADATQLTSETAIDEAGLYTLAVSQAGQTEHLPVALVVAQALTVTGVGTDSSRGPDKVSDSGGTAVTLAGTGFAGILKVHWFEADAGFEPNRINEIQKFAVTASGIRFNAPPTDHQKVYQIVVRKPATAEEVTVATLLTGIDDTRPRTTSTQSLTYNRPVRLVFDEAVTAAGFGVVSRYRDYSGKADEDVSHWFELVQSANVIQLRLKTGGSLAHNRIYDVSIHGIADLNGNGARNASGINGGSYAKTFTAQDTLAPRDLSLVRKSDGQPVTPAMLLTCGRTYTFVPAAVDNMTGSSALKFATRISTNGGLSFEAPRSIGQTGLALPVQESDQAIAIRLKATDKTGQSAEQRYDAAVRDPEIIVAPVYTEPAAVEELSRADICFDLSGDTDLLTGSELRVFDRTYPVSIEHTGAGSATICLSYLNPRLRDITGDQVPLRLRLTYGFSGTKFVDDAYTLLLDATPPTVSIASPPDGAGIPLGEVTSVLIKSFDRYGIDRVEAAVNGGDWQILSNPGRFDYTPTALDPVSIAARAIDSNGIVSLPSAASSITLKPYDATKGEPRVALLAPPDGAVYHAGEPITLEAVMRNLAAAELFMDVGGNEDDARNPAPFTISRGPDDPERFAVPAILPAVDENLVVVLRLQAGALSVRRFINVLKDDGIAEVLPLSVTPPATILTGTQLWVDAQPPEGMSDFSDNSTVSVEDPAGAAAVAQWPVAAGPRSVAIGSQGDAVKVSGALKDRSGNEKVIEHTLVKWPYLADTSETVYMPDSAAEVTADMVVVPGLAGAADGLVFAVNHRDGGYQLRSLDAVLSQNSSGALQGLQFTGGGLVAQEVDGATRTLLFWPLEAGALGSDNRRPVLGEVLGGSGTMLFTRHGDLFDGYAYADGRFVPVAGQLIGDPVRMVRSMPAACSC